MDYLNQRFSGKDGAEAGKAALLTSLLYRRGLSDEKIIDLSLKKLEKNPEVKRFDEHMFWLKKVIDFFPPDHPRRDEFSDRYRDLARHRGTF